MTYETRRANQQATRERIRLAAVGYLRNRPGSRVEITTIAKAIGVGAPALGTVVQASPMTFRARSHHSTRSSDVVVVELHPHLVLA